MTISNDQIHVFQTKPTTDLEDVAVAVAQNGHAIDFIQEPFEEDVILAALTQYVCAIKKSSE